MMDLTCRKKSARLLSQESARPNQEFYVYSSEYPVFIR